MKRPMMLAVAAAMISAARAAPDEAAYAAFVAGAYEKSAEIALAAGGAENHALAARAVNALAYFEADRKATRKLADRAADYAKQAIKEDPRLPEGYLQAAIGEGLRAAKMAPARAFLLNLPSRVRNYLDEALRIDAQNPWALSTSAAWRMEVARRGGGKTYGAVAEEGLAEFRRARDVAPDNIAIAYECALRVLASRRPEWRAFGLECLGAALAGAPLTAFERAVQARAGAFKSAIDEGSATEADYIEAQP